MSAAIVRESSNANLSAAEKEFHKDLNIWLATVQGLKADIMSLDKRTARLVEDARKQLTIRGKHLKARASASSGFGVGMRAERDPVANLAEGMRAMSVHDSPSVMYPPASHSFHAGGADEERIVYDADYFERVSREREESRLHKTTAVAASAPAANSTLQRQLHLLLEETQNSKTNDPIAFREKLEYMSQTTQADGEDLASLEGALRVMAEAAHRLRRIERTGGHGQGQHALQQAQGHIPQIHYKADPPLIPRADQDTPNN